MLKDGGTMEDIGFSIVKPSKDGRRPGYRFGDERDDAGFDAGRNRDNFGGSRDNDGSGRNNPNYTGDDANKGKIKGTTTDKGGTGRDDQGNKVPVVECETEVVLRNTRTNVEYNSDQEAEDDIADSNTATIREEITRSLKIKVAAMPPLGACLLYTSPSPRDGLLSRMPSSA